MSDISCTWTMISAYEKLLDELRLAKVTQSPEIYNAMVDMVQNYRCWVVRHMGSIEVSEVPPKISQ